MFSWIYILIYIIYYIYIIYILRYLLCPSCFCEIWALYILLITYDHFNNIHLFIFSHQAVLRKMFKICSSWNTLYICIEWSKQSIFSENHIREFVTKNRKLFSLILNSVSDFPIHWIRQFLNSIRYINS